MKWRANPIYKPMSLCLVRNASGLISVWEVTQRADGELWLSGAGSNGKNWSMRTKELTVPFEWCYVPEPKEPSE